MKQDNFLKICSFTKHLLIAWTNFVFFLPGLNYKYPPDNTRQGLNAHMQFIANDATLQIGIGDTRGLPASLIVTHSPAMFACDACGKVYRYYRNLQSHVRQECGKEPRILCPFCPYRTKIKSNLKKHIQIKHPVTATQIILWKVQGKTDDSGHFLGFRLWEYNTQAKHHVLSFRMRVGKYWFRKWTLLLVCLLRFLSEIWGSHSMELVHYDLLESDAMWSTR